MGVFIFRHWVLGSLAALSAMLPLAVDADAMTIKDLGILGRYEMPSHTTVGPGVPVTLFDVLFKNDYYEAAPGSDKVSIPTGLRGAEEIFFSAPGVSKRWDYFHWPGSMIFPGPILWPVYRVSPYASIEIPGCPKAFVFYILTYGMFRCHREFSILHFREDELISELDLVGSDSIDFPWQGIAVLDMQEGDRIVIFRLDVNLLTYFHLGDTTCPPAGTNEPTPNPTLGPTSEYSNVGVDIKCPIDSEYRLFRTPNDSPLTVEECFAECSITPGCKYFSLGVNPTDYAGHVGVCIGCKEGSVLESHSGFHAYQMTVVTPPPPPPPDTEDYSFEGFDIKCPISSEYRLFRTPNYAPLTVDECFEECMATSNCKYFSLGVNPTDDAGHVGVCIGCEEGSPLESHRGFHSYAMSVVTPPPPPPPDTDEYAFVGFDIKCPLDSEHRLFRTPDFSPLTVDECFEECLVTTDCKYFSLGINPTDNAGYVGVCIGCKEGSPLASHRGFHVYEMSVAMAPP